MRRSGGWDTGFRAEREGGAAFTDTLPFSHSLSAGWGRAGPGVVVQARGGHWWESKPGFNRGGSVQQNQRRAGGGNAGGIVASWGVGSQD